MAIIDGQSGFAGAEVVEDRYFSFGEIDTFPQTHPGVSHTYMGKVESKPGEDQRHANFRAFLQLQNLVNTAFEEIK